MSRFTGAIVGTMLVVLGGGCSSHDETRGPADESRPANLPSPFALGGKAPAGESLAKPLAQGEFPGGRFLLSKVRAEGAILTVEFLLSMGPGQAGEGELIPLREVSYVDDDSGRRFGVLKDAGHLWMAAPIADSDGHGDAVRARVRSVPVTIWFKFPAPPAASRSISLQMPVFGKIDHVPLRR